jgi:hypothetical protein
MTWTLPRFYGRNLELELLDPNAIKFHRLFRHPNMDWDPPDVQYRNERVDPPPGHKHKFAVLYLASNVQCVAMECRVLMANLFSDKFTWAADLANAYKHAQYRFSEPAIFVPLDGRNCGLLGLDDNELPLGDNLPFQTVALELFERFGNTVHGLSWRSMHRGQPGRVYALWHHHKATIGLSTDPRERIYPTLNESPEWLAMLDRVGRIERVASYATPPTE